VGNELHKNIWPQEYTDERGKKIAQGMTKDLSLNPTNEELNHRQEHAIHRTMRDTSVVEH